MYGYRTCAEPGCQTYFVPKSSRNRYCLRHRNTKPVDREHDIRYGSAHRRLGKQWARKVERGGVECWRCGELPNAFGLSLYLRGSSERVLDRLCEAHWPLGGLVARVIRAADADPCCTRRSCETSGCPDDLAASVEHGGPPFRYAAAS